MGGVENHLFLLSQCLMQRGHKVVIVTHAYGDRNGVRLLTRGLKVYYLPIPEMYNGSTFPLFYANFPFLRCIFIRERINHVHGHQAFSSLCHEGLFHASTMNIPCTFTDHSLFGFADASSIFTNKALKFALSGVDNVICVSHTSKENTVLRAALDPARVFVIPNAVLSEQFTPDPSQTSPGHVTIVVLCRLVYRKGVDLLTSVIPKVCAAHPTVRFLIAGDGPKKVDLEQMRDEQLLHDRMEMTGSVASEDARNVMVKGQIFLNTSLTEAFCMAILEAASCGLLVVSTKVGGVPEVLPSHMMLLSEPESQQLTATLLQAVHLIEEGIVDTSTFHEQVAQMYSWTDVAKRTEQVYLRTRPEDKDESLASRLSAYYGCGEILGKIACCMVVVDFLFLMLLEWLVPRHTIDIAPDFAVEEYEEILRRDRVLRMQLASDEKPEELLRTSTGETK